MGRVCVSSRSRRVTPPCLVCGSSTPPDRYWGTCFRRSGDPSTFAGRSPLGVWNTRVLYRHPFSPAIPVPLPDTPPLRPYLCPCPTPLLSGHVVEVDGNGHRPARVLGRLVGLSDRDACCPAHPALRKETCDRTGPRRSKGVPRRVHFRSFRCRNLTLGHSRSSKSPPDSW